MKNDCDDLEPLIEAIADGSHEPGADARQHLASCPACAARLETVRAIENLLIIREAAVPPASFTAAVMARIGQPFEQANNNPMLAREGTGLGLSVVKALVGEHGGEFKVESREDAGTTVTVTLPRRQEQRQAA